MTHDKEKLNSAIILSVINLVQLTSLDTEEEKDKLNQLLVNDDVNEISNPKLMEIKVNWNEIKAPKKSPTKQKLNLKSNSESSNSTKNKTIKLKYPSSQLT